MERKLRQDCQAGGKGDLVRTAKHYLELFELRQTVQRRQNDSAIVGEVGLRQLSQWREIREVRERAVIELRRGELVDVELKCFQPL